VKRRGSRGDDRGVAGECLIDVLIEYGGDGEAGNEIGSVLRHHFLEGGLLVPLCHHQLRLHFSRHACLERVVVYGLSDGLLF
jgi:hypothetical protein